MRRMQAVLVLAVPLTCLAAEEPLPPLREPVAEYTRRAAAPESARCVAGESVVLPVLPSEDARPGTAFDAATGRLHIRYRMQFNDLTEGWNWHPLEAAQGGDYYVFKYLPLGSIDEDRGSYIAEDKIGSPQEFRIRWRYDYFFAFDNPYDFYSRADGDEVGFAAEVALPAPDAERLARGDLRMALRARLAGNCLSDSTTFWKGMYSAPVDFTLKKRYLIGKLEEVWFYDAANGRVLARLVARDGKPDR
jgi:hypothetical protein